MLRRQTDKLVMIGGVLLSLVVILAVLALPVVQYALAGV
jgi:hypothetical protein